MKPEWLSAHLDGELDPAERATVDEALAADPALAAEYAGLADVRRTLRGELLDPPHGVIDRIIAEVEAADAEPASGVAVAPVVRLADRRRVPTFAAAAAAMAIIASVVGGIGGAESLPAIGDFVAQHEAAAAVVAGAPMPDDMADEMMDMDEMPMPDAMAVAPTMPDDMAMAQAYVDGSTIHLVYLTSAGEPVSVFRHEGDTDVDDLGEGSVSTADGADMWSAPRDGRYVVVIDGTGYVWVVVSDGPHDDMMDDMMDELPSRSPSLGDRLRDMADAVVDPFAFGGSFGAATAAG